MKKLLGLFSLSLILILSSCNRNEKDIIIDEEYGLSLYDYKYFLRVDPYKEKTTIKDFYGVYNDANYGKMIVLSIDKFYQKSIISKGEVDSIPVNIGGFVFNYTYDSEPLPMVYTQYAILTLEEAYYYNSEVTYNIEDIYNQFVATYGTDD